MNNQQRQQATAIQPGTTLPVIKPELLRNTGEMSIKLEFKRGDTMLNKVITRKLSKMIYQPYRIIWKDEIYFFNPNIKDGTYLLIF